MTHTENLASIVMTAPLVPVMGQEGMVRGQGGEWEGWGGDGTAHRRNVAGVGVAVAIGVSSRLRRWSRRRRSSRTVEGGGRGFLWIVRRSVFLFLYLQIIIAVIS
jgi:hypothetical protein